jgi:hypothetical protein
MDWADPYLSQDRRAEGKSYASGWTLLFMPRPTARRRYRRARRHATGRGGLIRTKASESNLPCDGPARMDLTLAFIRFRLTLDHGPDSIL